MVLMPRQLVVPLSFLLLLTTTIISARPGNLDSVVTLDTQKTQDKTIQVSNTSLPAEPPQKLVQYAVGSKPSFDIASMIEESKKNEGTKNRVKYLLKLLGLSESEIESLINTGKAKINGKIVTGDDMRKYCCPYK